MRIILILLHLMCLSLARDTNADANMLFRVFFDKHPDFFEI